jgi:hypothetical protein
VKSDTPTQQPGGKEAPRELRVAQGRAATRCGPVVDSPETISVYKTNPFLSMHMVYSVSHSTTIFEAPTVSQALQKKLG